MSKAKNYKKEWDLTQLYKNEKELDAHVKKIERGYKKFEKKYKDDTSWLKNEKSFFKALKEYEDLIKLKPARPYLYLYMANYLNMLDDELEAKLRMVSDYMTHVVNRILFFSLEIGKLPKDKQREYLKSDLLKPYRYFLKQVFESSKYQLSLKEEQLLNLMSQPSHDLWVQGLQKEYNKITIKIKGEEKPITEVFNLLSEMPTKERRKTWEKVLDELENIADFSTHELNAIVTSKKIRDRLRGYKEPYSATVLSYENTKKEVENLVDVVTKNFNISRKFYKLKKELMGLEELLYVDKSAPLGKIKKSFSFNDQVSLFKESLENFGEGYVEMFENMLYEGRVDVKPRQGKRGGACCMCGAPSIPVFVLLNDVESFYSYMTLAHEMGHAFHGELTQKHTRDFYGEFPTSTAEVASTFFENVAFDRIFKELSPKEQVIALHQRISDSIATIFRQIALFNFEKDLHEAVRTKGSVSKDEIKNLLCKHMKAYLGKSVDMNERDGLGFIAWPHIRYFFYVYSYAYGSLVSSALYEKYKEDPSYEEKVKEFLSLGGSLSPKDIFKKIGLNTSDPAFFELGLKKIDKDIRQLRSLAKKVGMLK